MATTAAADALFRSGREAFARGDYAQACGKFQESYRLQRAVGTLLNLAICEEERGHGTKAVGLYREVLHWLAEDHDRLPIAKQRLSSLEHRLPAVTIRLREDSRVAIVWLDGIELRQASFGVALPLEVGRHKLLVKSPGRSDRAIVFEIVAAERREILVQMGSKLPVAAVSSPAAPPTPSPSGDGMPRRGATQRTMAYSLLGVAGATLVFGAASGALVLDRDRVVGRECGGHECTPNGLAAARAADRYALWSTVGFIGGAAAGVIGATLLLTLPSSRPPATSLVAEFAPLGSGSSRAGVAPPFDCHLRWAGRF